MLYRTMPKNGDKLSILGFGCMRLPLTEKMTVDEKRAINQIRSAIDRGVNYLDTAWPYHGGESENILGRALKDGYREKVKIATKLPTWMIKSREDMDRYLDAQLDKLQTGTIDYYLLHALDGPSWDKLEGLGVSEFLDMALSDKRIGNAAFSFHGKLSDFKRIVDAYPWTMCQIQYNYLDQENQAGKEGLIYAADRGLGVVVMEPLRGGNLGLPTPPAAVGEIWKRSKTVRTPVAWALRWVWNHPEVTVVLSGMNDELHIDENLKIAESSHPGSLTQAELVLVDEVAETYRKIMKVGCTGCGYCQPCPEGVKIPGAFELYNTLHLFGKPDFVKMLYAVRLSGIVFGGPSGFASNCIGCGECVDKCPQQIDIPGFLEKVANELEDDEVDNRIVKAKKMLNMEEK